jgi:hypothetical protein
MTTHAIRLVHHFSGEQRHTTTHRVSSASGLAGLLEGAGQSGWGARAVLSRAAFAALGGYETKGGETVIPLPGRDPVSVDVESR